MTYARSIFWKPTSSWFGVTTDETRSVAYTYNQAVFVRALRVYRRAVFLPRRVLQAAAGYDDPGSPRPPEDTAAARTSFEGVDFEGGMFSFR